MPRAAKIQHPAPTNGTAELGGKFLRFCVRRSANRTGRGKKMLTGLPVVLCTNGLAGGPFDFVDFVVFPLGIATEFLQESLQDGERRWGLAASVQATANG
jgi:hypothetical protein